MSKQLTTPVTVNNLTRLSCLDYKYVSDGDDLVGAWVTIQARQPANGRTLPQQMADGYAPTVLYIQDGTCDTYLTNGDATFNPYVNAFKRGRGTFATALTDMIAAEEAANKNQKHNAVVVCLSESGIIDPVE
jgi:hypothetical protein